MRSVINQLKHNFNDVHFILLWTVVNLFQAYFTELTSDEGYYWFYGSRLDWGYYDHPPLLALFTYLGRILVGGELGVRILNILLISVGVFYVLKTIEVRNRAVIYLILLSLPLFNYVTFIAFPDSSLVAITGFSLYAYKNFSQRNTFKWALLLALSFTLMMYAKYHAALFIIFLVASNWKLLKNKHFYFIAVLSLLLYLPHLYWQHTHGYPSFLYHLYGRSKAFKVGYLFEYIGTQVFVLGLGLFFVPFVVKASNQFEKTVKYIAVGTVLFFGLSALRGFVHMHWTSIALFPIVILASKYYLPRRTLLKVVTIPFVTFIIVFRLYLMFKIIPVNKLGADYFHERDSWAAEIKAIAQDKPVIFDAGNSGLREAPLYSFYANATSLALFPGLNKKSQYQIWKYEDSVQLKDAVVVRRIPFEGSTELKTQMGRAVYYKQIDGFQSFTNIKIEPLFGVINDQTFPLEVEVTNHRLAPIKFDSNQEIYISIKDKEGNEKKLPILLSQEIIIEGQGQQRIRFHCQTKGIPEGTYQFTINIYDKINNIMSINSDKNTLIVRKVESK